jgi:glycosidase
MSNSVPIVYSGQEEPVLRALAFFEKDPITFQKLERQKFYATLQKLKMENEALAANASFRKIVAGDEKAVYAFVREKGNKKVLVILNLSAKAQIITVKDAALAGKPLNIFMRMKESVQN